MTKPEFLMTKELGKCREFGVFYSPRSKKHICNKSPHCKFFPTFEEGGGVRLPFKCRPLVCLKTGLATVRSEFVLFIKHCPGSRPRLC